MDRRKAIKYLEQHKYFDTCEQKSLEESNEALDLAIEALQEKLQLSEEISTNTLTCNHTCNKKQVTGKSKNPDDSLVREDVEACKEQESKLESDLISRQAAIDAIRITIQGQ